MSKDMIGAFFVIFAAAHVFASCRNTLRAMTPDWKTAVTAFILAAISGTAMYSLHPYRDMYTFHASAALYGISSMGLTLELFFAAYCRDWLDEIDELYSPSATA